MYIPVDLKTNEPARLIREDKFTKTFITHDQRILVLTDYSAEHEARQQAVAERIRLNGRTKADH